MRETKDFTLSKRKVVHFAEIMQRKSQLLKTGGLLFCIFFKYLKIRALFKQTWSLYTYGGSFMTYYQNKICIFILPTKGKSSTLFPQVKIYRTPEYVIKWSR